MGKQSSIALVVGSDSAAVWSKAMNLREKFLGSSLSDWNYSEHDGEGADIDDILGDILTPPFVGDLRVVLVKRVTSLGADQLEKLSKSFEDMPESVRLIATAANVDKRSKFYRAASKLGEIIDLTENAEIGLPQWVADTASELGLPPLPRDVVTLLVQRAGGSTSWLRSELAKLAAYLLTSKEPLTAELAERLISAGFEDVANNAGFELLDLIAAGETGRAVELCQKLLASGQAALPVLGTITWQYRMVVAAASLQSRGVPAMQVSQEVAKNLKVHSFPARKAATAAARLGYKKACEAFDLIFQANYQARLGVYSFDRALELLVIRLAEMYRK